MDMKRYSRSYGDYMNGILTGLLGGISISIFFYLTVVHKR